MVIKATGMVVPSCAQVEVVLGGGVSLGVFCGSSAAQYLLVFGDFEQKIVHLFISSLICVWFVGGSS